MINCERIAQALIEYDPDAQEARVVKAEDQRVQLLARFPKDGWPEMTLDRYALGQPDHPDNFCRWMEFVTTDMGSIKGGSARKHLIYYQARSRSVVVQREALSGRGRGLERGTRGFPEGH